MTWQLADKTISSRMLLGSSLYPSPDIMREAIVKSESDVVTVSLRRHNPALQGGASFWSYLNDLSVHVLPNTAGCMSAKEAIVTAQMARELFNTRWIKLEVIGNDYTLQPDPIALVEAAKELCSQGFEVFPYCTEDLVIAEHLVHAGCRIVMPWAAPIGSGRGPVNLEGLMLLRERLKEVTLIVDAGLGAPSHAAKVMELGFDGVLLNTAVAQAHDPIKMASAFAKAVDAGREAYIAGVMRPRDHASASTPEVGKPFWHQE
ncbi:thiazole synthase [Aestuariibacter sp. AA17]|uniref:Thiazole synthase n=1 Tax=Fluctibacter corallii TaxID=2984329 RepID=A0ABT3AC26_9ALTE|nr:thiazole synthase [Aestuariibacter sp. AA17]MCV2886225.1 thiazole synthase [Aestuariibacter sp. AA17]